MKSSRGYKNRKLATAIGVLAVAGGLTILGLNSTKISRSIDEAPNKRAAQYMSLRPGDMMITVKKNSHDQDDSACRVLCGCSELRSNYLFGFPMALKKWPLVFDELDPSKSVWKSLFVNVVSELSDQLARDNVSEKVFSMSVVSLDWHRLNGVFFNLSLNKIIQLSDSDEAYIQNMVNLVVELAKIDKTLDADDFIKEGMKAVFNSCKNPYGLKLFRGAIPSTFAGVTFVPSSTTREESLSFTDEDSSSYRNEKKKALHELFYDLGCILMPGPILRRSPGESIMDALRKGDAGGFNADKLVFQRALQLMSAGIYEFSRLKQSDSFKGLDGQYGGFAVEHTLDMHFLSVAPNLMADAEEMVAAKQGLYKEFETLRPEYQELDDSNGNCKRHLEKDSVATATFNDKLKEASEALKIGSAGPADAAGAAGAAGAELPAAISELSIG